jgi:hypothetical protein
MPTPKPDNHHMLHLPAIKLSSKPLIGGAKDHSPTIKIPGPLHQVNDISVFMDHSRPFAAGNLEEDDTEAIDV